MDATGWGTIVFVAWLGLCALFGVLARELIKHGDDGEA